MHLILALTPLWASFQFKKEGWVSQSCLLRVQALACPKLQ